MFPAGGQNKRANSFLGTQKACLTGGEKWRIIKVADNERHMQKQPSQEHTNQEHTLTGLLVEAARLCAEDAEGTLARLAALAGRTSGAAGEAVYQVVHEPGKAARLCLAGGAESPALRAAARAALKAGGEKRMSGQACAAALMADGAPVGVWALDFAGTGEAEGGAMAEALAPFFLIGLRQAHWRGEADLARQQAEVARQQAEVARQQAEVARQQVAQAQRDVERRIREVATVYEVGQAMDKVEIDRLLEMITERAAQVMDAQACSLLLKMAEDDPFIIAASYGLADEVVENTRIFVGEGIAGQVAATGEALRLDSQAGDGRAIDMPAWQASIGSSICMPMKDENGQVQGVLCIRRAADKPCFTDEDLRLFSIFATQVSLAINNAQLYARLNHKLQELSTLAALTETISSTLDLDQVLNQVADNIVDVVHFDRCRIYLADMESGKFAPRIVRGFPWLPGPATPEGYKPEGIKEEEFEMGEGVIGQVAQRQVPILVEDIRATLPSLRAYGESLGIDSYYAQPIVARGRCIGVLVVSNTGPHRPITAGSTDLLSTFVGQAGIAIENARFYQGQENRFAELTTLYEFSSTLAATSGVQTAAETITELAVKITDSDTGLLLLFDAAKDGLSAIHWHGVEPELGQRLKSFASPVPVSKQARDMRLPRLLSGEDAESTLGPEWRPIRMLFMRQNRAAALIPLIADDELIGFLVLGKQSGEYSSGAVNLIAAASQQAAAVLANARSYERRIGQRELELSAIRELMQKLRAATALDEALDSILDIVASLVWSDESCLFTLNEDGKTLTVRAARGPDSQARVGRDTLALDGDSIAARALHERTALIAAQSGRRKENNNSDAPSEMALPLLVGDEMIGVLTMQSQSRNIYSEDSVKMLHLVTSQAATIYREMSSLRTLTRYTDNILRSIAAGVITMDKNGFIVTWNRRAEEIINLRAHQIVGQHYREFIQRMQVDVPVRNETMRMVELTAQTGKVFTRNQLCYRSPQGEETYVNLSASQLRSEAGEYLGIVVVFEDVTSEFQMKEEVERVSKLAETGQLAANIAHELRNPLSSIKGAAQLLRSELPADYVAQHGEFLDIIVDEVNGLNRMTTEFLEFSRVTPPEMRQVDLNAQVLRLLQLMQTYLGSHEVTVIPALDDDLPLLFMDKGQIEQVMKNIVINAAQAMPHGGYLTIGTRHFAATDIVELSFTDTGNGIPPDKMGKIWTPFFTTKTKGTGLGLAIARKIAETHGGRLSVRTTPGEGSTFTLHLPVNPLHPEMMSHARAEITEQRSDTPGALYEARASYASS